MVYSNVPNRDTGKFSAALALREAAMVSSATSTPGTGKFSAALALREATTVSSAPSNRATAICVSVAASMRL